MSEYAASTENLTPEETEAILGLRLLIARAANRDSLAWWDDESLTPPGGFLLERVFPTAPALAARSLALAAAVARHEAACTGEVLHLYHLDADNQDGLALRFAPLLPIPVPREPIVTMDALRHQDTVCTLLSWGGGPELLREGGYLGAVTSRAMVETVAYVLQRAGRMDS